MNEHNLKRDQIEEFEIDLTGTCNLRCPLCTRNYIHAKDLLKPNIRKINEITDQLDSFTGLKRAFIAGAISEPTLYPQIFEFIQYLNSRKIVFELFTNGNTHDELWWKNFGKIIDNPNIVCFTVCGSTQQKHEKYRRGSSLEKILKNALAFRQNNKKNDWIQTIRFEYNKDDLNTKKMFNIIDQFSHHMQVDSEGIRRLNDKIDNRYDKDIMPIKRRDAVIKHIFSQIPKINSQINIECKSYLQKKIYIDQFGKISPCYIHAEFEKDFFDQTADKFNYSKIFDYCYADCFLCSQKVNKIIKDFNLEFIC